MYPSYGIEPRDPTLVIRGVRLPCYDLEPRDLASKLYVLTCRGGTISSITEDTYAYKDTEIPSVSATASLQTVNACGKGILLPSLCHGHIHLDKCYLLNRCDELITGDFAEALRVTAKAKAAFPSQPDDLYDRGKRLILESVEAGVTTMRAHVEVDDTVRNVCLDTGLRLKRDFAMSCEVQLAVFAQDPLFPSASSEPGRNWELLRVAAATPQVEAVGSAPYVETDTERAKDNIRLILDLAHEHGLHADFHLDYNLDASAEPLIWFVLEQLRTRLAAGAWRRDRHVCVGHVTRLALWAEDEWAAFARAVAADGLPVSLVGLPQSDMYMMGRGATPPPRGTLDPVRLARAHGLRAALAVNNVGNAFTPQGAPDPLAVCTLGVALFQAATKRDCATLLEAVTVNARAAIGKGPGRAANTLTPQVGDPADFVLLYGNDDVQSAACNPSFSRATIKAGRVVSRRQGHCWLLGS